MKPVRMYCTYTLPWYWKALIVAYDLCKCFLLRDPERSTASVFDTALNVFFLQAMLSLVLVAPSLCLSVADRVQTNVFVSEMLLLLAAYLLLIRSMGRGVVSAEHACFCLQFCSCYCFFCYFHATASNRKLLLGSNVVKWCSLGGMCVFPVCYSHLLQDCMHLSPYVLVFAFSGEVSGWACACCSHVLGAVEHVVNALYVRLRENA
jgi:hypothetical protein